MKPNHYLAIIVRIFSICIFIYAVQQSRMFMELITGGDIAGVDMPILYAVIISAFPLFVSVILWKFPLLVSGIILGSEMNEPLEPIKPYGFLAVLISAIGLFFLYYAISDCVYWGTVFLISSILENSGEIVDIPVEQRANLIATIFELFISLSLVFKSKTIASKILKVAT